MTDTFFIKDSDDVTVVELTEGDIGKMIFGAQKMPYQDVAPLITKVNQGMTKYYNSKKSDQEKLEEDIIEKVKDRQVKRDK